MVNIAVLGYGTVGSGVVEVIGTNSRKIASKVGDDINVKYILDLRDFPGDPYEDRVVHDYEVILNDPDISIVCETMGGLNPAYDFTKRALSAGKSVCTSNKELVSAHGPELIKIASENKCSYLFEASVGGGIPIIRVINDALTAEKIDEVTGILNGTTNYILTRMLREGSKFEDVLKDAQDLGYAERDPEADIEGYDAARKIAILTSLITGKNLRYEDVHTEGISNITKEDFDYAAKIDSNIKLFAIMRKKDSEYYAMVAPFAVKSTHPLYFVNDVFNADYVHGNMLDDTMYYGRGAGKLPTASAVVADVVCAAVSKGHPFNALWSDEKLKTAVFDEVSNAFLVRCKKDKRDKVLKLFGNVEVISGKDDEEFVFTTEKMTEKEFEWKASEVGIISRIRIMD